MNDIGIKLPFVPIGGTDTLNKGYSSKINENKTNIQFSDVLNQELIKFSGQAQNTMVSRDVSLDNVDILRLDEAIEKAKDKNAKEALVMLDDKMFIVAVDDKTVIKMLDKNNMEENVITNIDAAVFA
ncbi:MAG: flagellar protein [Bacteroidetes bacterium]|nr:flagellar protein [Bacteroidota bacterium]